jgi:hypothetical protein
MRRYSTGMLTPAGGIASASTRPVKSFGGSFVSASNAASLIA